MYKWSLYKNILLNYIHKCHLSTSKVMISKFTKLLPPWYIINLIRFYWLSMLIFRRLLVHFGICCCRSIFLARSLDGHAIRHWWAGDPALSHACWWRVCASIQQCWQHTYNHTTGYLPGQARGHLHGCNLLPAHSWEQALVCDWCSVYKHDS